MAIYKSSIYLVLSFAAFCIRATDLSGQVLDEIQAHIDAGEFGLATQRAEAAKADKDDLFGRIALAQAGAGASSASKATLRRIRNPASLAQATRSITNQAAGGATGADFDSLINLITSTVAPDSWDDVGGPGSMVPFEGGVYVDAQGVLRQATPKLDENLSLRRAAATRQRAQNDPRRASDMRMISLPRLQRELQLKAAFGETPSDAMKHLAGIREIQYVFVYPDTVDFVIAGPAGDWMSDAEGRAVGGDQGPVLLLDDLVILLDNADKAYGRFGCSITPKQQRLADTKRFLAKPTGRLKPHQTQHWVAKIRQTLGLQDIEVRGVDPESHVARILVEADYHMKLVGMGLQPSVPGVPSYLDSIDSRNISKSLDVLRWWFTLRPEAVLRNADGDAFAFADQTVRLQSENELITDRGERVHTGESTELNQLFATRFTKHYDRLAARYHVYAQLENLFRLALVATLIQDEVVRSTIDWNPDWLISHYNYQVGDVPREVPSIVNHRIIGDRHIVVGVSGGVTVDAFASLGQGMVRTSRSIESDRDVSKPPYSLQSNRWWWD